MAFWVICALAAALFAAESAFAVSAEDIDIVVENPSKVPAAGVPVSAGVPFARGAISDAGTLRLADAGGKAVCLQATVLSRWPDGSARWVLCDFVADAAGSSAVSYTLSPRGEAATPERPVTVKKEKDTVTLSNGLVTFRAALGGSSGVASSADSEVSAEIVSLVEIGAGKGRVTSKAAIDSIEVYAEGPVRAAVSLYGRRIYSDGIEGPFSQRVEMFAGSPYLRVEDTFVYAHFPGTHAEPEHPLLLWKLECRASGDSGRLRVASLVPPEEAEGLVVAEDSVAFWGKEPLDLSRHTDEELIGEDTPGIALGVAKSCAALVGLVSGSEEAAPEVIGRITARTTPKQYAASGAFGKIAPQRPGRHEKIEEGLRQILGFWLWFQDNDPRGAFDRGPWHGLFDWGDWQTRYADRQHRPVGWQYGEGRYGWDCNEMDTTLTLWTAFARTARPEYRRAATAMSRHMMDVDMINVDYRGYELPEWVYDPHSYGAPWKEGQDRLKDLNTIGLGRRHNVQHWGNGVGDTRHTWNGGVMMYYYMTGNRRAYDAAVAMADMHMERIWGYASGEYALSMWAIHNAWQLTGDAKYIDEFKYRLDVIHQLRRKDGSLPEHLDFDKRQGYPEVDGEYGAYLDLTLDYISNALIDYHSETGDAKARELLLGLAERNMKDTPEGPADYQRIDALRLLAWAFEQTGENRYLERAKYHMASLEAEPLARWPGTVLEWEAVFGLLGPHDWDIRVVGPAIRMAPCVMLQIDESRKD